MLVLTLASLLIVALGKGPIFYLVLMAMEAVQNALTLAPMVPRVFLFDRLNLRQTLTEPAQLTLFAAREAAVRGEL